MVLGGMPVSVHAVKEAEEAREEGKVHDAFNFFQRAKRPFRVSWLRSLKC